jgi:hypothetical protein
MDQDEGIKGKSTLLKMLDQEKGDYELYYENRDFSLKGIRNLYR